MKFNFKLPKGFDKNGSGTDYGKLTVEALKRASLKKDKEK
jgi:hypothetical protein